MNRWQALGIHLGISLVIFIALMLLLRLVWYPDFFFATDGGWEGVRIIFLVDMVIGPLLTLVVYKAGKPGLRMDLGIIALIQIACLGGGVWVVWSERPLALVYNDQRFYTLSADEYAAARQPTAALAALPGPTPKRAWVDLASNDPLRAQLYRNKQPVRTYIPAYVPLQQRLDDVTTAGISAELLAEVDNQTAIDVFLAEHGGSVDDYAWVPFSTRFSYVFLAVRKASDGQPAAIVDILPVAAPEDLSLRKVTIERPPAPSPAPPVPAAGQGPAPDD